jgi:Beta-galactosidase
MELKYGINKLNTHHIIFLFVVILFTFFGCRDNSKKDSASQEYQEVVISQNKIISDDKSEQKLVFPYGAVYFRKSNPPEEDWASDHKTAAELGVNAFRHWFLWSAIEVAPGKYDWSDYDRQMDLAAQNGLKVIIGEITYNAAPEWMFVKYPKARIVASDNSVSYPSARNSTAVTEASMCLDNEVVLRATERFQTALIERYRDHPALMGYDIWNEGGLEECFCEATQEKFREWLKEKYGSLEALGKAWNRYSMEKWENVSPPRSRGGNYADALDWLEFRNDNKIRLFHRRVELFRNLDKKHLMVAHGVAGSLDKHQNAQDEWRSAAEVDTWGFTWVASRNGTEPWKQFQAVDLVRAGSRGKPFWHSEAEAGSLWMQPQVPGRAREDGRISDEKDVRIWNLISMAGGASGIFYPRWRPLLDGPLWGAFGPMGMDGSVTPKAEMAGKVARWANANPEVWQSHPVKGDIGIVWVPESSLFNYVQLGNTDYYTQSVRGAYQGFFDSNIQADFVHIDNINEYPVVYLPYPVMLKQETANKLIAYVEQGGQLICEGLPGYWGDRGHVGEVQPNLGLDKLFGAHEKYVEFTPDLLENLKLNVLGSLIDGRYFLQEYLTEGGTAAGTFNNGSIAAVENKFGKGKTLLIGTFPGAGYYRHHSAEARKFFAGLLEWGNVTQGVSSSDPEIKARLHEGAGGKYLWVVNPTRTSREVTIHLNAIDVVLVAEKDLWGGKPATLNGNEVKVTVGDRDAAVISLQVNFLE